MRFIAYFSKMNIRVFLALFFTFTVQVLYAQKAEEGDRQTATENKSEVKPDAAKPDAEKPGQNADKKQTDSKPKVKAVPPSTRKAKPSKVTKARPSGARPSGARPPQGAKPAKRPVKPGNGRK